MAEENPRDKRRRPRRVGRPKEEGGHHRINISVSEFMSEALKKVPNKSKFLEEVARPVLEKMDPGDASVFLWKIDDFISQGIILATQQKDFKQVSSLSWLANCLEDARRLCGVPPKFQLPAREKSKKFGFRPLRRLEVNVWELTVTGVILVFFSLFMLPIFLDFARMPSPIVNATVWNSTARALEWIRPRIVVVPFVILFVGFLLLLLAGVPQVRTLLRKRIQSVL